MVFICGVLHFLAYFSTAGAVYEAMVNGRRCNSVGPTQKSKHNYNIINKI